MLIKDRIKNYCNLALILGLEDEYPIIGYSKRPYTGDINMESITDRLYWFSYKKKCSFCFKKYILW